MRLRILLPAAILIFLGLGVTLRTSEAQFDSDTCPTIIEDALNAVGNNCGALDRNSACYGYNVVQASFVDAQPPDFFTRPADRSALESIASVSTSPLRTQVNEWGIALLNVQANLPDTLPGRSVVFMLLGDSTVENAVKPEDTWTPGGTVNVTTVIGASMYYQPDLNAEVVGSVPQNSAATADAITPDGAWVRIVYNDVPGWVMRSVITTADDLSVLGVYSANTRTPMQAFYFRNNIAQTECRQAPDALLVQGSAALTIDITINGANVRMGSTALFRIIPVDMQLQQILNQLYGDIGPIPHLLQLIAIDGEIVIDPDTPGAQIILPGYSTTRCLSLPQDLGLDGEANDGEVFVECPWSDQRVLTPEELEELRALHGFGDGILNYPILIPGLPDEPPTPTPTRTPAPQVVVLPLATATPLPTVTPVPQQQEQPVQPEQPQQSTQAPVEPTAVPPTSEPPTPEPPTPEPPTPEPPTPIPCPDITFPVDIDNGDIQGLRDAIAAANNTTCFPGQNQINLRGEGYYGVTDVYAFDAQPTFTYALSSAAQTGSANAFPVITGNILISGAGSWIERDFEIAPDMRLFEVASGGSLMLEGVTLTNGRAGDGGAIYNAGSLSLINAWISGNSASGRGGGIYNAGTLNVSYTNFSENSANDGGAIYNAGTLSMNTVELYDNFVGGSGAGLFNAGTANLNTVTVYGNNANQIGVFKPFEPRFFKLAQPTNGGGGIFNNGGATINAVNVTLSDNLTGGLGGNVSNAGTLNFSFVTLSGGSASGGAGSIFNGGAANLKNTILASYDQTACIGIFNLSGVNFTNNPSCSGFTVAVEYLGLADYLDWFSFTGVHRLLPGSEAIDTVSDCTDLNGTPINVDQIGRTRPIDGDQANDAACDPGAVEFDLFDNYG